MFVFSHGSSSSTRRGVNHGPLSFLNISYKCHSHPTLLSMNAVGTFLILLKPQLSEEEAGTSQIFSYICKRLRAAGHSRTSPPSPQGRCRARVLPNLAPSYRVVKAMRVLICSNPPQSHEQHEGSHEKQRGLSSGLDLIMHSCGHPLSGSGRKVACRI